MAFERTTTEIADQRRDGRLPVETKIHMCFDTRAIEGMTDNISGVGLLFFTSQPVVVAIQLEEGGVLRRRTGRLVRAQRMNADSTGIAVEFDPE